MFDFSNRTNKVGRREYLFLHLRLKKKKKKSNSWKNFIKCYSFFPHYLINIINFFSLSLLISVHLFFSHLSSLLYLSYFPAANQIIGLLQRQPKTSPINNQAKSQNSKNTALDQHVVISKIRCNGTPLLASYWTWSQRRRRIYKIFFASNS